MDEKKINDEKVKEKVENKSQKIRRSQSRECEVLLYNAKKQTLVVSFNGLGYEFVNVTKNPGKTVLIKYTGKVGTPSFKLELV